MQTKRKPPCNARREPNPSPTRTYPERSEAKSRGVAKRVEGHGEAKSRGHRELGFTRIDFLNARVMCLRRGVFASAGTGKTGSRGESSRSARPGTPGDRRGDAADGPHRPRHSPT